MCRLCSFHPLIHGLVLCSGPTREPVVGDFPALRPLALLLKHVLFLNLCRTLPVRLIACLLVSLFACWLVCLYACLLVCF